MIRAINPSESDEQKAVIQWLRLTNKWLLDHTIYIINEQKCSIRKGAHLNAMGRRKGASDIYIAWPTNKYFGLFLEMKSKTGKPTKEQIEFIALMNRTGYRAIVANGADEAIAIIEMYLKNAL